MIFHIEKRDDPFTRIANTTLSDERLSWEALGMLSFLLSKPHGWRISRQHLINQRSAGKDKVTRILKELREAGYYVVRQIRLPSGQLEYQNTILEQSISPLPENPATADLPLPGNPPLVTTDIETTEIDPIFDPFSKGSKSNNRKRDQDQESSSRSTSDGGFETFWTLYPRKTAKQGALKAWRRLKPNPALMVAIQKRLLTFIEVDWKGTEPAFIPHPATWLNDHRWKDEIVYPSERNGNGRHARVEERIPTADELIAERNRHN